MGGSCRAWSAMNGRCLLGTFLFVLVACGQAPHQNSIPSSHETDGRNGNVRFESQGGAEAIQTFVNSLNKRDYESCWKMLSVDFLPPWVKSSADLRHFRVFRDGIQPVSVEWNTDGNRTVNAVYSVAGTDVDDSSPRKISISTFQVDGVWRITSSGSRTSGRSWGSSPDSPTIVISSEVESIWGPVGDPLIRTPPQE